MPDSHVVPGALRCSKVRSGAARALRCTAVIAGAGGLTAATTLLTAAAALASGGLQPGNLVLKPASGAVSLTPMFVTTDGCPAGFQGSAQVSMFEPNGTLISRISVAVPRPTGPFEGALDGKMGAILRYAGIKPGGTSQWAVGCYAGVGGTGNVTWVQSTVVGLSADSKSYSISAGSGQPSSASGQSGSGSGQSPSSSASKPSSYSNLYGQVASTTSTAGASSGSSGLQAGLIAGACGLVVAGAGVFFYRRRNRSQPQ